MDLVFRQWRLTGRARDIDVPPPLLTSNALGTCPMSQSIASWFTAFRRDLATRDGLRFSDGPIAAAKATDDTAAFLARLATLVELADALSLFAQDVSDHADDAVIERTRCRAELAGVSTREARRCADRARLSAGDRIAAAQWAAEAVVVALDRTLETIRGAGLDTAVERASLHYVASMAADYLTHGD